MNKIFLFLILLMGFIATANADQLTYQDWGLGDRWVYINYGGSALTDNPLFAGQLLVTMNGQSLDVYCLSVLDAIHSSTTVTVDSLDALSNLPNTVAGSGAKVAWLLNTYAPDVDTNTKAAALQMSIWEALYDSTYDLSQGQFSIMNNPPDLPLDDPNHYAADLVQLQSELSLATTYLNSIGSNTSSAIWLNTGPQNAGGQSFGYPVPEPGSLLLLGAGIGMLCIGWRRRQK
jgi:hypothetical protein